jgi:phosphomethylpyrimidine synthase
MSAPAAHTAFPAYDEAYPASTKAFIEGPHGIRVPVREIALSGGEPPFRVYDTSGPQGIDVRDGLPSVRGEWLAARARTGDWTQQSPRPDPTGLIPASLQRAPRACRRRWCAWRWRAAARSSPPTSTTRSSSR